MAPCRTTDQSHPPSTVAVGSQVRAMPGVWQKSYRTLRTPSFSADPGISWIFSPGIQAALKIKKKYALSRFRSMERNSKTKGFCCHKAAFCPLCRGFQDTLSRGSRNCYPIVLLKLVWRVTKVQHVLTFRYIVKQVHLFTSS